MMLLANSWTLCNISLMDHVLLCVHGGGGGGINVTSELSNVLSVIYVSKTLGLR